MPKAAPNQTSFNGGETSPLLYGRTDIPRYKQGLATCLNYIPTLQGPLTRRPGTVYVDNVKDSTKPPVLIPFLFSETQAYMLEFGDGYIRFYANGAPVVTSGTTYQLTTLRITRVNHQVVTSLLSYSAQSTTIPPAGYNPYTQTTITTGSRLEVKTPYLYTDLSLLRWAQNADTIYIVHPSYAPMKLQRHSATSWSLQTIEFIDGPYLPLNSYSTIGDSSSITLTPGAVGATIPLATGPTYVINNVTNSGGQILISTTAPHYYTAGQNVVVSGVTGTVGLVVNNVYNTASGGYWLVSGVTANTLLLADSVFSGAYIAGGTLSPALFTLSGRTSRGDEEDGRVIGIVTKPTDPYRSYGTLQLCSNAALAYMILNEDFSTAPDVVGVSWQMGVWSTRTGFPACVTFHQSRLAFAGAANSPQQVDLSEVEDYESFSADDPGPTATTFEVTDSNALVFDLLSSDLNAIHWIKSTAQGLLAGTYANEWSLAPSSQSEALTATNVNALKTSAFGSGRVDAVSMGNAVLYVQRALRKVRELNFFFQVGTFRSTDLSEISEHITLPTVTKLAVQKENLPLIWGIRSDGLLISLSYDRSDEALRAGWARHQLGGQSDAGATNPIVQSIAVIPSTDLSYDQMWMTVKRWLNGAQVITIEYMAKVFDESTLQEDAYFLDCGSTYNSPVTISSIVDFGVGGIIVHATAHGFANGDQIRIVSVIGLSQSTTDVDGNVTVTNLVNEKTFVVASALTNTFQLTDYSGTVVLTTGYSAWVSGGEVRKMVLTISGLTWLKNETVSVLADGAIHPNVVVSNAGGITLNYRAAKVQIGFGYNSDGQLLRPDAGAADGTSIGKTRRVSRVAIMLHRVGDFLMGMAFNRLIPVQFTRADEDLYDETTPLFTGIHRDGVESAYDFDGQFCFRQSSPLPGTVQAITLMLDETDV